MFIGTICMYACMLCVIYMVCVSARFSVCMRGGAGVCICVCVCVCACVRACVCACVRVRAFEPLLMSALCASFCLMLILKIKKIHFDVHYVFYVY